MSASPKRPPSQKSFTGHHDLLQGPQYEFVHPLAPSEEVTGLWTLGRGTVIWRIWPAVLLHSTFAAVVVVTSDKTPYYLAIANSLLVVIGVVIGFVIAYRASSGIDRYSQGRAMWGDVIKTSRTLSRLIWFHVPPRMTSSGEPTHEEINQAIAEKKAALGLIEGYAVALKHHLRGEIGLYYTDLYYLTLPLHPPTDTATATMTDVDSHYVSSPPPAKITFSLPENLRKRPKYPETQAGPSAATAQPGSTNYGAIGDPTTVRNDLPTDETRPLLPSTLHRSETINEAVATSFIPFWGVFHWLWDIFTLKGFSKRDRDNDYSADEHPYSFRHGRRRPKIAGKGQNFPLEIIRTLSEWIATLDARGTGGSQMGGMMGCLQSFENSLTDLERILTTPLPIIYSAHLRTVWLYLFFLPFQLIEPLGYLTILAVSIASFLYLGFLAAGEEIEQPFGYEENDLDLDLFIREIIHVNIDALLSRSTPNSYGALKPKDAPGGDSQGYLADTCKAQIAAKEAHAKQKQQAEVVAVAAEQMLSA
ncbi:hypothetical protein M407DRAFT_234083 [Tulasnella calospora MUT 4182]|uniref:Uncharacterized protein n=1 Tax=Tulasnella calospora MUT 4182 TaxID=1051891 RepID=A0A0C3KZP7_9AGAM|nr:hypothetical protein M407DRAFT_234083 [Tulasnella calospora MUT 4182]